MTLTPDALTGSIGIAASADAFDADHVGSELRLKYLTEGSSSIFHDDYLISATTYYSELVTADNVVPFSKTQIYQTNSESGYKWRVYRNAALNSQILYYTCIKDYNPRSWVIMLLMIMLRNLRLGIGV